MTNKNSEVDAVGVGRSRQQAPEELGKLLALVGGWLGRRLRAAEPGDVVQVKPVGTTDQVNSAKLNLVDPALEANGDVVRVLTGLHDPADTRQPRKSQKFANSFHSLVTVFRGDRNHGFAFAWAREDIILIFF